MNIELTPIRKAIIIFGNDDKQEGCDLLTNSVVNKINSIDKSQMDQVA